MNAEGPSTRSAYVAASFTNREKNYADKKRRELELQVGDEVLLSTRNLPVQVAAGGSRKLGPLYCGAFTILEKLTSAYKLDLPPTYESNTLYFMFPNSNCT